MEWMDIGQWSTLAALVGWHAQQWRQQQATTRRMEVEAQRVADLRAAYLAKMVEPRPGETPGRALIRARLTARAVRRAG